MEDEPIARFDDGDDESFGIFFDGKLGGLVTVTGEGDEFLTGDSDGLHVLIEQGDVELVALDGDFAMHGFVFAELEDASFVRPELDTAVSKQEAGGGGENEAGDEFGFHVV